MTQPLVTICVPTRNRAEFLQGSLQSILAQDYTPLDVLISDNGSTDATETVCREVAAQDSRVRYVRHPENIGLYENHNFCLEQSRGEFLGFFHDDDHYEPVLISQAVKFLQRHPSVGVVCSNWALINDDGQQVGIRDHVAPPVTPGLEYIERTIRSGRSTVGIPGSLLRRAAIGDIRFDESGPIGFGDFAVWFRMAQHHDVGHVASRLWSYRIHQGSLSRRTILSMTTDYRTVVNQFCDEYSQQHPNQTQVVHRWRHAMRQFLFWALAFEVGLHVRPSNANGPSTRHCGTIFEMMDYQLTPAEFDEARQLLREYQTGWSQRCMRAFIELSLRSRCTWPLAQATRFAPSLRPLLGLS